MMDDLHKFEQHLLYTMEEHGLYRQIAHDNRLNVQDMLEKAGNSGRYQLRMLVTFFFVFFCAAFIQMGFPMIFQPARFACPRGQPCTEQVACENDYPLSPSIKSVAYTFNLTCERKRLLNIGFNAFLFGGFIGSLYYGDIIERRGRRYAVIESMVMMTLGVYCSIIASNITIFSIGVFFFNAGFRGFYNVSLLSLTEVMNDVSRASTPMILSIGWALGQIFIALIGLISDSWRVIFILTAIPLTILTYYSYTYTLESPRFLVVKLQFQKAREIIEQIAMTNENRMESIELIEQISYNQKMKAYREIMGGGELTSRLKHHSYMSLFNYNSIRIRVFIVGGIWLLISLSYFISANSLINPNRSIQFNIALAGVVEIIAYLISILTSLNLSRVYFIKRLLIVSGVLHLCYFFIGPLSSYHGISVVVVMTFDIGIRVAASIGNTFLAIYALELFPTSIRHYALGMLGFITKLTYMLSGHFSDFWTYRHIHPNFIIGMLLIGIYFSCDKLRETQYNGMKDNLSEDGDGTMMNQMSANLV